MSRVKTLRDTRTFDLFEIPQPLLAIPGQGNYSVQVSEIVGAVSYTHLDVYKRQTRWPR